MTKRLTFYYPDEWEAPLEEFFSRYAAANQLEPVSRRGSTRENLKSTVLRHLLAPVMQEYGCEVKGAPDKKQTGLLIRRRRKELGMSQAELARRVGNSEAAVGNVENGRYFPSDLAAYAAVLGVTEDDLLG